MEREFVHAHAALFGQPGLGEAPKGLDAVDVALASGKFVFMMMHPMMFEPIQHQSVISLPAVRMHGGRAFDMTMNHS